MKRKTTPRLKKSKGGGSCSPPLPVIIAKVLQGQRFLALRLQADRGVRRSSKTSGRARYRSAETSPKVLSSPSPHSLNYSLVRCIYMYIYVCICSCICMSTSGALSTDMCLPPSAFLSFLSLQLPLFFAPSSSLLRSRDNWGRGEDWAYQWTNRRLARGV